MNDPCEHPGSSRSPLPPLPDCNHQNAASLSHLQLSVLLLEVLVFIRVAVRELVDLDAVLLDLLPDLRIEGFRLEYILRKDTLVVCGMRALP